MATQRKIIFVNDYYYHVYNRGLDNRDLYTHPKEYSYFVELIEYYRLSNIPIRYSRYKELPAAQKSMVDTQRISLPHRVTIVAYCLMPNHFHLLLKQDTEDGISSYMSDICNGYAKYYNLKFKRIGPLFQGIFRAVLVDSDEQLLHTSRYIHINPYVSSLVKWENIPSYPWSSLQAYHKPSNQKWINSESILRQFKCKEDYMKFVSDQISYGKELERIKHFRFEE